MKQKYIDLHTHTFYSDGISFPEEIVRASKLKGIDILAITDHDNFRGYWEAKQEADKWGLTLVPGVEFSAGKYHILGLNFNPYDTEILNIIEKSKALQKENSGKRAEMLARYGMPMSIEKIEHYFPEARLGKMNVFMTMLKDKKCREWIYSRHENISTGELKDFYLSKNGIAGGETGVDDLEKEIIINGTHDAGGLAILAHPPKDVKDMEKELGKLRELGINGLEVQPRFYEQSSPFIEYAKKHNLLITYGSDYHGAYMDRELLGRQFNTLSPELEERLFPLPDYQDANKGDLCYA